MSREDRTVHDGCTTRHTWFVTFRHVNPADLEKWFEAQAREGWAPEKVGQWSSIRMTFRKGKGSRYRYAADMQVRPRKDYRALWEDAGWEFVGRMASLMLWRKRYRGKRPEAFTDAASIEGRSNRFVWAVVTSALVFAAGGLALLLAWRFGDLGTGDSRQVLAAGILFSIAAAALAVVAFWMGRKREGKTKASA
jgi:hypothetical protein